MKKMIVLSSLVMTVCAFRFYMPVITEAEMRPSIQNSLNLLQSSSHAFIENAGCFSCHGQSLGLIAFTYGREKRFHIADSIYDEAETSMFRAYTKRQTNMLEHTELLGGDISVSYTLWALGMAKKPAGKTTDIMVNQLLERQTADGHWVGNNSRPPLEYYSFSATAMAIYGIEFYQRPGFREKIKQAKHQAVIWLTATTAINNEEKAFQLLGLHWAHADSTLIQQKAQQLLSTQHVNGGWSQLDSLETDAYATGQSVYALIECGALRATDTSCQRAVRYLLETQKPDGSWRTISRSHPFLPHVSSGFPYGKDQFISAAGTNWATIALLQAIR